MTRLGLVIAVAVLGAGPALAGPSLLPEEERLTAEAGRVNSRLLELHSSPGATAALGLGVTSLLVGVGSAATGLFLFNMDQVQFFVPLVVVVPLVATLFGVGLVVVGAVVGTPPEEQVKSLEDEREALLERREALRKARETVADAVPTCSDGAVVASAAR